MQNNDSTLDAFIFHSGPRKIPLQESPALDFEVACKNSPKQMRAMIAIPHY